MFVDLQAVCVRLTLRPQAAPVMPINAAFLATADRETIKYRDAERVATSDKCPLIHTLQAAANDK